MAAGLMGGMGGGSYVDLAKGGSRATGALLSGIGNKKAAKEYSKNYNSWLQGRGNLVNDITSRLAGSGYNIFGPQTTSQNTTGQNLSTTQSAFDTLTMPQWAKADKGTLDALRGLIQGREAQAAGGYKEQVLNAARQAANNAAIQRGQEQSALSRRGINIAGAGVLPSQRALNQQVLDITTQLPRQFGNEDIGLAQQFLGMTRGQRQTGTSTSQTNQLMSQLQQTMSPPDFEKLLRFLQPPTPQQGTAGMGWNTLGGMFTAGGTG